MYKILVINPGSTSTKIAVFEDERKTLQETIRHQAADLHRFACITDQHDFRKQFVLGHLHKHGIDPASFAAVIGRGGMTHPLASGVYAVNPQMLDDLRHCTYSEAHACNLGGLIADSIARDIPGCLALIADPVVVDEFQDVARISGLPLFPRRSTFHALNHKAIARRYAREAGRAYEELNLIVVHMGGGISVGAHRRGQVVDVNQALDGYGPFSPERAGTLPSGDLVELCFSGKYDKAEIKKMLVGKGGVYAHLHTTDMQEVAQRADNGDNHARLVLEALAYNVAKEIGAMAAVLAGKIDAILLTGGIACNQAVVDYVTHLVQHFAPVKTYPGEDEMEALGLSALRVLRGEAPRIYR